MPVLQRCSSMLRMSSTQEQSTVEWAQENVAGSFGDAGAAAVRLAAAARHCHLIGGASVCPLIEGHEIVISVVPIAKGDTYPVNPAAKTVAKGGQPEAKDGAPRWGIGGSTILQIAAAAAVEWTDVLRVDDGRNAHFAHYRVLGRYPMVDGTWRPIGNERDCDLRDGSDQIKRKTELEVQSLRENLVRSTITKAKLRALRDAFGLRQGLLTEELDKPFVVARVIFTGRSDDPQIRRMFAAVLAQRHLAATQALFGVGQQPALLGAQNPIGLLAEAATPEHEIVDEDGVVLSPPARQANRPAPTIPDPPRREASQPEQRPAQRTAAPAQKSEELVMRFGKDKGVPLSQLSAESLAWYCRAMMGSLEDPAKEQYRARNEEILAALLAEDKRRAEAAAKAAPEPADVEGAAAAIDGVHQ